MFSVVMFSVVTSSVDVSGSSSQGLHVISGGQVDSEIGGVVVWGGQVTCGGQVIDGFVTGAGQLVSGGHVTFGGQVI